MNQLNRGRRLVEVLKQLQYQPLPVEKQVIIIYAATNGYLDDVAVLAVRKFETEWLAYVQREYAEIPHNVRTTKQMSDEDQKRLHDAAKQFKTTFKA